jgi:hypothetical protein
MWVAARVQTDFRPSQMGNERIGVLAKKNLALSLPFLDTNQVDLAMQPWNKSIW